MFPKSKIPQINDTFDEGWKLPQLHDLDVRQTLKFLLIQWLNFSENPGKTVKKFQRSLEELHGYSKSMISENLTVGVPQHHDVKEESALLQCRKIVREQLIE